MLSGFFSFSTQEGPNRGQYDNPMLTCLTSGGGCNINFVTTVKARLPYNINSQASYEMALTIPINLSGCQSARHNDQKREHIVLHSTMASDNDEQTDGKALCNKLIYRSQSKIYWTCLFYVTFVF